MRKNFLAVLLLIGILASVSWQTSTLKQSITRGETIYKRTCITCHQRDGGGVAGLNPPLINTEYVTGDKTRLISILMKGLNKPIEIEDETYSNPMPAVALNDQEIADVLTYVRKNFGNNASPVSVAEVIKVRGKKIVKK